MAKWNNKMRIFHPKAPIIIGAVLLSVILLIYSLGSEAPISVIRYFSYLFSTYTLIVTVMAFPGLVRHVRNWFTRSKLYGWMIRKLEKNPYTRRWLQDIGFRTLVALWLSAATNAIFIFLNLYSGIRNRSEWFIALAIYYFLLAAIKVCLILYS